MYKDTEIKENYTKTLETLIINRKLQTQKQIKKRTITYNFSVVCKYIFCNIQKKTIYY